MERGVKETQYGYIYNIMSAQSIYTYNKEDNILLYTS